MNVLELMRLGSLMARTVGDQAILVAVIDGPVLMEDQLCGVAKYSS